MENDISPSHPIFTQQPIDDLLNKDETIDDACPQSVEVLQSQMDSVLTELKRLHNDEKVMNDLHVQCRQLQEQFHERNVLDPLFLTIIGIIDRCRQKETQLDKIINSNANTKNKTALQFIRQHKEAYLVDRIELGNLLANYGVEAFEQEQDSFNPETQKCIKRIETKEVSKNNHISKRVLPGYRYRNKILRPEIVHVLYRKGESS